MWILGETLKYFTVHSSRSCQTWHNLNFAFNMESPLVFSTHNYPLDLFKFFLITFFSAEQMKALRWKRYSRSIFQYICDTEWHILYRKKKKKNKVCHRKCSNHRNRIQTKLQTISCHDIFDMFLYGKKKFSRLKCASCMASCICTMYRVKKPEILSAPRMECKMYTH